jgi:hypothetical protein
MLGNFGGAFVPARLTGQSWRESTTLDILMNTRPDGVDRSQCRPRFENHFADLIRHDGTDGSDHDNRDIACVN